MQFPTLEVRLPVRVLAACCLVANLTAQSLSWQQRDGYRFAELKVPPNGHAGFTALAPAHTGVWFTHQLSINRAQTNQNLLNGAGVAAGDFDGDGWCDLYFCNTDGSNILYHNRGGFRFEDVTARAGVACLDQTSKGAVFADINGDGRVDLLTTSLLGPNNTFLNLGAGLFSNITAICGMAQKAGSHSLAVGDLDGNGTLDVYVCNYGENSILRSGGRLSVRTVNGQPTVTGRFANRLKIVRGLLVEFGEPDKLFLNDGRGVFTAVPWTAGAFLDKHGAPLRKAPWDMGLTVTIRDINEDGQPDLYVCNDFQGPDRIWINDGRGHFREMPDHALRSTCSFSMAVDFADVDRDGRDEIMASDMLSRSHDLRMRQITSTNPSPEHVGETWDRNQVRRNTLQWNRGDLTYAEIAHYAGLEASDWTWAVAFLDVDLDGYEDILLNTGHSFDTQDSDTVEATPTSASAMQMGRTLKEFPALITPNVLFRNRGDRTFEEVGARWGYHSTRVTHGLACADLDNDGDLDVVGNCLWTNALIYRNESSAPRVAVRCRGQSGNTQGIGAKIKVTGGAVPVQTQEIIGGGRYLSGDDPLRVFAAGSLTNRLTIEVTWRSGGRSVLRDVRPNCIYEVDEAKARPIPATEAKRPAPPIRFFRDESARLNHLHRDLPFQDFERQPLLHKTFSRLGPGVACADLNGDGHEDLIIGSGHGGEWSIFLADGQGHFAPGSRVAPLNDDLAGLASWVQAPGRRALLAALSNYEHSDAASAAALLRYEVQANGTLSPPEAVATLPHSIGPLAVADVEGDGDLDVFIGGRIVPGRYPQPATSMLLRNQGGVLTPDARAQQALREVGLVSGAVFSDLDGDGLPELILACEWGPLRLFRSQSGTLTPWDPLLFHPSTPQPSTITSLAGWWSGVTTGDLDGDGRLDIIASNWGINSSYHDPTNAPARILYGDLDGNGSLDVVEAYTPSDVGRLMPLRDLKIVQTGLPLMRQRFSKHALWARADLATVLGPAASTVAQVQANTLASMVFFNRGARFEAVRLPEQAQWAPAYGVNVADFDGDGREDVFLSQNCFDMRPEESRLDAGRGLWLRGLGEGRLEAVAGQESGVMVYGQQRGSAVADFNEDGRVDLVVSQNSAETKLFLNERARPGLRVRLKGPPGNPDGIGATVRLLFGQTPGPAREIHAGSGYWSQDSAVQVMATPTAPSAVWVRWPGGKTQTVHLSEGVRDVVVQAP